MTNHKKKNISILLIILTLIIVTICIMLYEDVKKEQMDSELSDISLSINDKVIINTTNNTTIICDFVIYNNVFDSNKLNEGKFINCEYC